eukprot:15277733-Alexandrium_andersonii.AAC.1
MRNRTFGAMKRPINPVAKASSSPNIQTDGAAVPAQQPDQPALSAARHRRTSEMLIPQVQMEEELREGGESPTFADSKPRRGQVRTLGVWACLDRGPLGLVFGPQAHVVLRV